VLTVVKVGGALGRGAADGDALRALCNTLGQLGGRHPLLVVPGGGGFADAVREADRRFGLPPAASHRMAILGMEQFGWLLSELIPHAVRCAGLARARELAAGQTAVLLPAGLRLDALPASWDVTSDSIAAWVADEVRASRLVLVKEVDGLFADWPAQEERLTDLSVVELAALRAAGRVAGVDPYLPTLLERAQFETWVIGGRQPERVVELLERGTTTGTRIFSARLLPWRHG